MIKTIFKIFLISIIGVVICSNVYAYSDELYKFDLPSTYGNLSYQNMRIFSDSKNSNRAIMIYAEESAGLKKSVWSIDDSDLNRIVSMLGRGDNIISKDKKSKLGKEKAIKVFLKDDDNDYYEIYILLSNKYVYMVAFTANSQLDLDNADYKMVKDSFKLKDMTTNPTVVYILGAVIVMGASIFFKSRKKNKMYSKV